MTTFDQIWTTFLNNCKTSDINLPQSDEKIYEEIANAIMLFNNRFRSDLKWDSRTETVDRLLNNDELLILANYIKLVFVMNEKNYYQTLMQPFSSDIGLKNFGTQLKTLENSVKAQEDFIDRLIMNAEEDYL